MTKKSTDVWIPGSKSDKHFEKWREDFSKEFNKVGWMADWQFRKLYESAQKEAKIKSCCTNKEIEKMAKWIIMTQYSKRLDIKLMEDVSEIATRILEKKKKRG